ncbi:MAG: stalk domain-containing protein [Eubacteriales bacterium]|nr:stalk domain-containing protein [Eubacteriales bacterium]
MLKKIVSMLLVMMLVLSLSVVTFAVETEVDADLDENQDVLEEEDEEEEVLKDWEIEKNNREKDKDEAEAAKDALEEQKDELEAAIESGLYEGEALAIKLAELDALKAELNLSKENFRAVKATFMESIRARREAVLEQYTEDELNDIELAGEYILAEDSDATIIPVDSIISNKAKFKFDTPPVIKMNRTLIPVRAITEGFGAEVEWLDGVVTITKDDITIELHLDSNIAIVNGEEVEIDSQASIKNNRMYVPLRFISETFGLEVTWEPETQTIEIN